MKFQIEDRGSILKINPRVPHVIVSISDTPDLRQEPATNDFTRDVLFLEFHDIHEPTNGFQLFTEAQAVQVINFYTRYRSDAELMIAHCSAGMSRSPGIIAALQKIHTGDDNEWFKRKTPNSWVYNMVLGTAYERGLFQG